ncbi:Trm112 family protein [Nocardioides litoris]|uniref:Trm112 family protein n=1 Tax=Nocardioides litoris TaxID=1926648 RepID=UPI001121712C|nr:Trm112 family protein [Nocardioides litoris]
MTTHGIDEGLLEIIVCPADHGDLAVTPVAGGTTDVELVCGSCGLAYPVRDGIPVLLVDEARRP